MHMRSQKVNDDVMSKVIAMHLIVVQTVIKNENLCFAYRDTTHDILRIIID